MQQHSSGQQRAPAIGQPADEAEVAVTLIGQQTMQHYAAVFEWPAEKAAAVAATLDWLAVDESDSAVVAVAEATGLTEDETAVTATVG